MVIRAIIEERKKGRKGGDDIGRLIYCTSLESKFDDLAFPASYLLYLVSSRGRKCIRPDLDTF
jgi:hypothetical protein